MQKTETRFFNEEYVWLHSAMRLNVTRPFRACIAVEQSAAARRWQWCHWEGCGGRTIGPFVFFSFLFLVFFIVLYCIWTLQNIRGKKHNNDNTQKGRRIKTLEKI